MILKVKSFLECINSVCSVQEEEIVCGIMQSDWLLLLLDMVNAGVRIAGSPGRPPETGHDDRRYPQPSY